MKEPIILKQGDLVTVQGASSKNKVASVLNTVGVPFLEAMEKDSRLKEAYKSGTNWAGVDFVEVHLQEGGPKMIPLKKLTLLSKA
jgi:hypothetical protein